MFDVITFGSATLDVFVPYDKRLDLFKKRDRLSPFLPLGEKLEGVKVSFHSGGGGINSASTFANQGLRAAGIYRLAIIGAMVIVAVVLAPKGIMGAILRDKGKGR